MFSAKLQSILATLVNHASPRVSINQLSHYVQSMQTGKFRQFDHRQMNWAYYNSSTPPDYQLKNVVSPIYLYQAAEDLLISRLDVEHLRDELPNVMQYRIIPNWNHVDFTYGRNSRKVLYLDILAAMEVQSDFY